MQATDKAMEVHNQQTPIVVNKVTNIPFDQLAGRVSHIAFDLENTLELIGVRDFSMESRVWLRRLKKDNGIEGWCLATNSTSDFTDMMEFMSHDPVFRGVVQPTSLTNFLWGLYKRPKKPQAEYYLRVREQLGNPMMARILFVDDKFTNVMGAIKAGMWGVLVNPLGPDLAIERFMRMREKELVKMAAAGITRAR